MTHSRQSAHSPAIHLAHHRQDGGAEHKDKERDNERYRIEFEILEGQGGQLVKEGDQIIYPDNSEALASASGCIAAMVSIAIKRPAVQVS